MPYAISLAADVKTLWVIHPQSLAPTIAHPWQAMGMPTHLSLGLSGDFYLTAQAVQWERWKCKR